MAVLHWSEGGLAEPSGSETPILNLDSGPSLMSMGIEGSCLEKGQGCAQVECEAMHALGRPHDHKVLKRHMHST